MSVGLKRGLSYALGIGGLGLGIYFLINLIRSLDFGAALALLSKMAPVSIAIILLPALAGAMLDSLGWRDLLPTKSKVAALWPLVRIRTSSEAVVNTVPAGSLLADPLKAWLVARQFRISVACATSSVALRTFLLANSQAALMVIVAAIGFGWLSGASQSILHNSYLAWISLSLGILALIAYTAVILAISKGSLIASVQAKLERIKWKVFHNWLVKQEQHFSTFHNELKEFGGDRAYLLWITGALFLLMWCMDGIETYIVLHVLGSHISFTYAFSIEVACSFLRSVAFFIPSGIGLQDSAYVGFLSSMGEHAPLAAAFIIIKRLRQILWIVAGYLLLVPLRKGRHILPVVKEATDAHLQSSN